MSDGCARECEEKMSLRCPKCGREFDVTLFQYGRAVRCPCGELLSSGDGHTVHADRAEGNEQSGSSRTGGASGIDIDWEALEREIFLSARLREEDRARSERIRIEADRIAQSIANPEVPRVDVEIEIRNFRARVLAEFPEKSLLFETLYVSRFHRLWNHLRADEGPLRI
jgi:hypothetical protein